MNKAGELNEYSWKEQAILIHSLLYAATVQLLWVGCAMALPAATQRMVLNANSIETNAKIWHHVCVHRDGWQVCSWEMSLIYFGIGVLLTPVIPKKWNPSNFPVPTIYPNLIKTTVLFKYAPSKPSRKIPPVMTHKPQGSAISRRPDVPWQ